MVPLVRLESELYLGEGLQHKGELGFQMVTAEPEEFAGLKEFRGGHSISWLCPKEMSGVWQMWGKEVFSRLASAWAPTLPIFLFQ